MPQKKFHVGIAITIIIGLSIAVGIFSESIGRENLLKNKVVTKEEPSQKSKHLDNSEWSLYTNKELGISFTYPKKWGEAREYSTYQDGDPCLKSGKQVSIYFEDIYKEALRKIGESTPEGVIDIGKSPIYFVFTSPDFSHCGYDYPEIYKGDMREIQDTCKETDIERQDCRSIPGLTAPSVMYYKALAPIGGFQYHFEKQAKIVSPNARFKGVFILYNMGLEYPATPGKDISPSKDRKTYTLETYERINNHKIDKNILETLNNFDEMLKSITFFNH